jgi:thiol-disulfide isomerase/thioredoxin
MSETPSSMMPLGTTAPDFNLLNTVTDNLANLQSLKGEKGTMIMFICNHCPYVKHIMPELVDLIKEYDAKGIRTIAINANDVDNYPDDAPDKMQALAAELGNPFAYLYDETQAVAQAYQAACTPDFYLFNHALSCVYRGRMDGATPKNKVDVTGIELRGAMDKVLEGVDIPEPHYPSLGCNIKWKS